MTNIPKISIITVNYNKGNYIEETMLSVINQNYPNLEYIVIDGASTDNSIEIIKKYEQHLAYFVSEPDSGMTEALIKGFNKATGDILAWINSDDTYLPHTFKYVAEYYNKKNFDFLWGDCLLIDASGNKIKYAKSYFTNHISLALDLVPLFQPSCFWSKKIYEKVNGLNMEYVVTMDYDLFIRILMTTKRYFRTKKILSKFRIHPNQSNVWAPKGRYLEELALLTHHITNVPISQKVFYKLLFKGFTLFLRIFKIR